MWTMRTDFNPPDPFRLEAVHADGRQPVAITIDQRDAVAPNPLYLRSSHTDWLIAKSFVDTADFNLQAISTHLYRQHFVAEPFAMTTRRQLSPAHPVYVLLEPHIAYTLQVNKFASDGLKQPGSIFDEIHAGELADLSRRPRRRNRRRHLDGIC